MGPNSNRSVPYKNTYEHTETSELCAHRRKIIPCENTMRRCHLQTKGEASEETKSADTLILEF